MSIVSGEVDEAVTMLWDYMQLKQPVEVADVMVVLDSRDDRVATYAAELMQRGVAKRRLITGGSAHSNDLLQTHWAEATESEHFANIMETAGIDKNFLLIEDRAINTGQNATYSHKVLSHAESGPNGYC